MDLRGVKMKPKKMERLDMNRKVKKASAFLYPLMVVISWFTLRKLRYKLEKKDMKGLKPPYVVLATHAAFIDFEVAVMATFPHRPSWMISIEEYNRGETLMRSVGGIAKRKFTKDIVAVKHVFSILKKRGVVIIYPEARYSLAGVNEHIDGALGKLIKKADVPVVMLKSYGHFIRSPQWDKKPYRKVPMRSEFFPICTAEEVGKMTGEEIQKRIEENFIYDDYRYQRENRFRVKCSKRMENAHKILYRCPHCLEEYRMKGEGIRIRCENCRIEYELDEYGTLKCLNGETKFSTVPEWYAWEREEVEKEVASGHYRFVDQVKIEELMRPRIGFVPMGTVKFIHDLEGMKLEGTLDDGTAFSFFRPAIEQESCHVEYFFKNHRGEIGSAIDVADIKHTYFIWLNDYPEALTKIHFATEAIYRLACKRHFG